MKKSVALFVLAACVSFATADPLSKIIVWLKPGVTPQYLATRYPVKLLDSTVGAPFAYYSALPGFNADVIEGQMMGGGLVTMAEDDETTEAPENVGAGKGGTIAAVFDPQALFTYNSNMLKQINWKARSHQITDRTVRVGILDTGIPATNPSLKNRVVSGLKVASDRVDWFDAPSGVDSNHNGKKNEGIGHGSMVAGLIAQLAPYSRFLVARVADADGVATAWSIIKGLVFTVRGGAEVVNVSLGTSGKIKALSDIIEGWVDPQGVIVVSPVGNNSWEGANEPAKYSSVLSVAGVGPTDIKATFSNWDRHTMQCAPATGIKSAWWNNTFGVWSGTSFAAPLVTATIADALRSRPRFKTHLQMEALRNVVKSIGDNIDGKNPNYKQGLGKRLNFVKLGTAIIGM